MKELKIKAKIYHVTDGKTAKKAFANISINDEIFINSFSITNTSKRPDTMSVFPPGFNGKDGRKHPFIEFNGQQNNPYYAAIISACLDVYQKYSDTGRLHEFGSEFTVNLDKLTNEHEEATKSLMNQLQSENSFDEVSLDDIPSEFQ